MMPLLVLLATLVPSLIAQPGRFGTPHCSGPDQELADRTWFLLCYSGSHKTPAWVGYELKPGRLAATAPRPRHFRRDPGLTLPAATDSDYRHSGLTRGHLAPARDFAFSAEAIRTTFLLSNVVPQRRRVNSSRWAQLENAVRRIALQADSLIVYTGVLFESPDTQFIGAGKVAVPTHLFKVILALRGDFMEAYAAIIPNTDGVLDPLTSFTTSIAEVQRRSGLDFFNALDDEPEHRLEAERRAFPQH